MTNSCRFSETKDNQTVNVKDWGHFADDDDVDDWFMLTVRNHARIGEEGGRAVSDPSNRRGGELDSPYELIHFVIIRLENM